MDDEWEAEAVYNDWATAGAEAAKKVPTTLTAQAVKMLQPVFDMGCATWRLSTSDFAKMVIKKSFFCGGTGQMAFALYPAVVTVAVLDLGIGTDKCSTVLGAYLVKEFAHVYAGGSRRECFDFASRDVAELCLEGIDKKVAGLGVDNLWTAEQARDLLEKTKKLIGTNEDVANGGILDDDKDEDDDEDEDKDKDEAGMEAADEGGDKDKSTGSEIHARAKTRREKREAGGALKSTKRTPTAFTKRPRRGPKPLVNSPRSASSTEVSAIEMSDSSDTSLDSPPRKKLKEKLKVIVSRSDLSSEEEMKLVLTIKELAQKKKARLGRLRKGKMPAAPVTESESDSPNSSHYYSTSSMEDWPASDNEDLFQDVDNYEEIELDASAVRTQSGKAQQG
ncbi:hypothetical protein JCM16303_005286 [Sporobolomyces ruberrimus]